jgi:hypothetical protein
MEFHGGKIIDTFSGTSLLSSIQQEAIDLYRRGLNVFPVMRPEEVSMLSRLFPQKYSPNEKRPYQLNYLFTSRLHLCGPQCTSRNGRRCQGDLPGVRFIDLFHNKNLAVMLGRTSGNLVCLDCDEKEAFKTALKEFGSRGLKFWAYTTSRGGNLLFRIKEGETANQKECGIDGAEIWGYNHFCVLPPSVHSTGVIYTWLENYGAHQEPGSNKFVPLLEFDQVEWLGIKLKKSRKQKVNLHGLPDWTKCLSESTRGVLTSVIQEGQRNIQLTKATYDIAAAIQNGYANYQEGETLLFEAASRCIPPYPASQIRQMLKSAMQKPGLELSKEHYSGTEFDYSFLERVQKFSAVYDWQSHNRTSHTDRAVFNACIERFRMDGKTIFRASSREIAMLANIQQHHTVSVSLQRLCRFDLIRYEGKDRIGSNLYSFGEIVRNAGQPTINTSNYSGLTSSTGATQVLPQSPAEQDVFRKIGHVGQIVWNYLKQCPARTAAEIARACGLKASGVRPSLKKILIMGWSHFLQQRVYTLASNYLKKN